MRSSTEEGGKRGSEDGKKEIARSRRKGSTNNRSRGPESQEREEGEGAGF